MWYSSPPIFHGPLWISKLSRLTGLKIFLPGHSWNRSGLRATYTAPLQPLQTKPALHNCHLNAKHFSLGWSVPFVHTFLRKVVLLEHNIFTCFTACWAWAAGIVSYSQNLHRIINGVLLSILLQCIDIVLLFPTKPTHQCNGICSCDGICSVWWVNFPSALSRAEKCGHWEHKLNSQAHFKAGLLRQSPDNPFDNFISNPQKYKSQWSARFLQEKKKKKIPGAGIAVSHPH